jgi:hypothetical protein
MRRKIPIGVSDFKEIIERDYHYIDKSLLIKEILQDGSKVILLPRPRRFGKTLNMFMLKYFFEKTKEDNSVLFNRLKIWENESLRQEQGKYPVIFLTFKDVKYNSWDNCLIYFKTVFQDLYAKHRYLLNGEILSGEEREYYLDVLNEKADVAKLSLSIKKLCEYLLIYHGKKTIILLDEYDTPIYAAWSHGYYDKLIEFVRNLMSESFKDNSNIEKAIITGIMRIAKESIFSGLNNLKVSSVISEAYSDKFGFTEEETKNFLDDVGIDYKMEEVSDWYNGYVFGKTVIYNPWSIINYADSFVDDFKPYWVNTSSSDLIRDILTRADITVKEDMEVIITGGELVKTVYEDTVLSDIENNGDTVWSFLLFSGYLKAVETWREGEYTKCKLKIPNREVKYVFKEIIQYWINSGTQERNYKLMLKSLTTGDVKTFGKVLRDMVEKSLSYFDIGGKEPEKFYHAFVLGMMMTLTGRYQVKSNRESGYGRYDVMLIPNNKQNKGCILEFKKVEKDENETLKTACEAALKQIEQKGYKSELESQGIMDVIEVGIAFEGKSVMVMGRNTL